MSVAINSYSVDHGSFPAWSAEPARNAFGDKARKNPILAHRPTFATSLTTPIAYITQYYSDPCAPVKGATFCYWTRNAGGYMLWSPGPDGKYDLTLDNIAKACDFTTTPTALLRQLTYDPTNGIDSGGDIYIYKFK